ncbi:MAG: DUF1614 domain-containing protein [Halobacteriota archaeon]
MLHSEWLVFLGIGTLFIALLLSYLFKAFKIVGFDTFEVLIMLLAPLALEFAIGDFFLGNYNDVEIYADPAGFFIPIILSTRFLASGRAPIKRAIPGIIFISYIAHVHSTASHVGVIVKDIGTLVLITSLYSLYASKKPEQTGPLAYVCGTIGVIIGADVANLSNLSIMFGQQLKFTIGGAGMFDAIYIVGLLAVVVDLIASSVQEIIKERS